MPYNVQSNKTKSNFDGLTLYRKNDHSTIEQQLKKAETSYMSKNAESSPKLLHRLIL